MIWCGKNVYKTREPEKGLQKSSRVALYRRVPLEGFFVSLFFSIPLSHFSCGMWGGGRSVVVDGDYCSSVVVAKKKKKVTKFMRLFQLQVF